MDSPSQESLQPLDFEVASQATGSTMSESFVREVTEDDRLENNQVAHQVMDTIDFDPSYFGRCRDHENNSESDCESTSGSVQAAAEGGVEDTLKNAIKGSDEGSMHGSDCSRWSLLLSGERGNGERSVRGDEVDEGECSPSSTYTESRGGWDLEEQLEAGLGYVNFEVHSANKIVQLLADRLKVTSDAVAEFRVFAMAKHEELLAKPESILDVLLAISDRVFRFNSDNSDDLSSIKEKLKQAIELILEAGRKDMIKISNLSDHFLALGRPAAQKDAELISRYTNELSSLFESCDSEKYDIAIRHEIIRLVTCSKNMHQHSTHALDILASMETDSPVGSHRRLTEGALEGLSVSCESPSTTTGLSGSSHGKSGVKDGFDEPEASVLMEDFRDVSEVQDTIHAQKSAILAGYLVRDYGSHTSEDLAGHVGLEYTSPSKDCMENTSQTGVNVSEKTPILSEDSGPRHALGAGSDSDSTNGTVRPAAARSPSPHPGTMKAPEASDGTGNTQREDPISQEIVRSKFESQEQGYPRRDGPTFESVVQSESQSQANGHPEDGSIISTDGEVSIARARIQEGDPPTSIPGASERSAGRNVPQHARNPKSTKKTKMACCVSATFVFVVLYLVYCVYCRYLKGRNGMTDVGLIKTSMDFVLGQSKATEPGLVFYIPDYCKKCDHKTFKEAFDQLIACRDKTAHCPGVVSYFTGVNVEFGILDKFRWLYSAVRNALRIREERGTPLGIAG